MEAVVWCAIGAALGWVIGGLRADRSRISRIEDMLAGMFGAFIGADFLVAMIWGAASVGLSFKGVMLAGVGSLATLGLVAWMRHAVGPLRPSTKKKAPRF